MTDLSIRFQNVSFSYDRATQALIRDLTVHFPRGWTGIVGANGVGKSTVLKLATGDLKPQGGQVIIPASTVYCRQRTDRSPTHLKQLVLTNTREACRIKGQLGVAGDWIDRWTTLSHGERKRAQIAVAMWRNPQVLAVDEPTNHLDAAAQDLLFSAFADYRGVSLVVSHDRRLLGDLCRQCLFVDPPDALLRPGNYYQGLQQAQKDATAVLKQRTQAKQELKRLKRAAAARRDAAARADRKRSKRGLKLKDHDARDKIDLARVTGKDGSAGKRLNQLKGRLSQVRNNMDAIKVKKEHRLGIWLPGARSKRNTLFNLPAGTINLGGQRRLHIPDLTMKPDDRIALTGLNGSGKSTLIDCVIQSLNLSMTHVAYVPQEIDVSASRTILAQARSLPGEKLGQMMTVISCLGSRPQRLLESNDPSPGEVRKILLATGIASVPHLIVMDEPTNHMDLPSIECLEKALADCSCGLLLVSHDRFFLDALTSTEWHISQDKGEQGKFILEKR